METASKKYRGIVQYRNGKWLAKTYGHGQHIHLGYYETPKEAALAYDCAQILLNGSGSCRNFQGLPDLEMMEKIHCILVERRLLTN